MKLIHIKKGMIVLSLLCGVAGLTQAQEDLQSQLEQIASSVPKTMPQHQQEEPSIHRSSSSLSLASQASYQDSSCPLPLTDWLEILKYNVFHGGEDVRIQSMKDIYAFLEQGGLENKLPVGETILDILKKASKNCLSVKKTNSEQVVPFNLKFGIDLNSCYFTDFLRRLSQESHGFSNSTGILNILNTLVSIITSGSSSSSSSSSGSGSGSSSSISSAASSSIHALEALGRAGLMVNFKGQGELELVYNVNGNACGTKCNPCGGHTDSPWFLKYSGFGGEPKEFNIGCAPKSCSTKDQECSTKDPGSVQAVGKLIQAFSCSVKDPRVQKLLKDAVPYGLDTQQQRIYELLASTLTTH